MKGRSTLDISVVTVSRAGTCAALRLEEVASMACGIRPPRGREGGLKYSYCYEECPVRRAIDDVVAVREDDAIAVAAVTGMARVLI